MGLAGDGKKMSKRLKNYADPTEVVDKFGADALRVYLMNSPVVRAEPLKFQELGVRDVAKDIFIPWSNCYRFFIAQARRHTNETGQTFAPIASPHKVTDNIMDKWILSSLQTLVKNFNIEMKAYRLYSVIPFLLTFIDQLSRWYVRFNKGRFKGKGEDCTHALATLFKVLMDLCLMMAPFTPFLVENIYQNLKKAYPKSQQVDSVHYLMVPTVDESAISPAIERKMRTMQEVVELGRACREKSGISFRVPVPKVTVIHTDET